MAGVEVVGHGLAAADPGRGIGRRHVGFLGSVVAAARMPRPSGFVNSYFYKTGFKRPESTRQAAARAEERRVGKECVSTCRSRGSPAPEKKTRDNKLTTNN